MPPTTVEHLTAELRRIVLPMGLVVDRLEIQAQGASLDTSPFKLVLSEPAIATAYVAALDIAAFLDSKAPGGLRDFAVAIREGKLYIEATAKVIIDVRANVVCTLRIQDNRALYVDLESVDVMGLGAKGMVQGQLDQINPILDVSDLPVSMSLNKVETDHDRIVLYGTITTP